ncbi:MAG: hypothetical protein RSE04_05940 [Hydrogenoanaerobacterium sp.]
MLITNDYYRRLIHEVQVVLNCGEEKAKHVVAYVVSLGGDPIEFIHRLPGIANSPTPDVDELLTALEELRRQNNVRPCSVCFPTGYENRDARRRANKQEYSKSKRRKP